MDSKIWKWFKMNYTLVDGYGERHSVKALHEEYIKDHNEDKNIPITVFGKALYSWGDVSNKKFLSRGKTYYRGIEKIQKNNPSNN